MTGTRLAIETPIPSPQYASWSKRSTCPVNAIPSVIRSSRTPTIHVSSLGYLCAPNRKTCTMWMSTMAIMKFDPHPCTARMNQPRETS